MQRTHDFNRTLYCWDRAVQHLRREYNFSYRLMLIHAYKGQWIVIQLVTAVDSSDSMVVLGKEEAVRRGLNNIEFRIMNAGHIDLEPESFDLVLCNLAFPFFLRPFDSMCEVFGVVRPGGTVMFTVPGRHTWEEFFEVVRNVLGDVITMAKPFLSKFTQAEVLQDATTAAGFEKLEEVRTRLPFHFANGKAVLDFFGEPFHLLDYAPGEVRSVLTEAIDRSYPEGFTMRYEAVLLSARRPGLRQSPSEVRSLNDSEHVQAN